MSVTLANYNRGMSSKSGRSNNQAAAPLETKVQEAEKKPTQTLANAAHNHIHGGEPVRHRTYGGLDEQTIRENMKKAFLSNPYCKPDDEAEYYETIRSNYFYWKKWLKQDRTR